MSCFESSSDRSNRERILPWNLTFGGDQPFQTTSLFMLDSGLLSYSVASKFTFQFPNDGLCPISKTDGSIRNLTFNTQLSLLQGIFNGCNLKAEKYSEEKGSNKSMFLFIHTVTFPNEFLNYRCSNQLCIPPFKLIFKNNL